MFRELYLLRAFFLYINVTLRNHFDRKVAAALPQLIAGHELKTISILKKLEYQRMVEWAEESGLSFVHDEVKHRLTFHEDAVSIEEFELAPMA